MTEREKNFKYHQENVLAIEEGIGFTMYNIKKGIIQEHKSNSSIEKKKMKRYVIIQTRILSGLIVSWSEEIIKRLYFEPNAFSDIQIEQLHKLNLQQKWESALKVAFCKAYNIRTLNSSPMFIGVEIETQNNVSRTARDRYFRVLSLIEDQLVPAINIRNKVQHGEWLKAFNPPHSLGFNPEMTGNINRENIVVLQSKINQIKALYQLIHDLAAGNSYSTFDRDFDRNYMRIESNNNLLQTRKLKTYKKDLIERYERGLRWKSQNCSVINQIRRIFSYFLIFIYIS